MEGLKLKVTELSAEELATQRRDRYIVFTQVFLGPRSHLCMLSVTFVRWFHPELRKKPHAYRSTACLCCISLIVVSLHICVSRIYRHCGLDPDPV